MRALAGNLSLNDAKLAGGATLLATDAAQASAVVALARGEIDDRDKVALYTLAYAFVFPSNLRSEAFGMSLAEASLFGKPMITCEIGTGTSFVNQDGVTGWTVPPDALDGVVESPDKWHFPYFDEDMGKIVESGRTFDIFTSPQHETTQSLLSAAIGAKLPEWIRADLKPQPAPGDPAVASPTGPQRGLAHSLVQLVDSFLEALDSDLAEEGCN